MRDVIVIGGGGRGRTYARIAAGLKDSFRIVAVAEPIDNRRNEFRDRYGIPEELCHRSWEELLSRPKFADLVVIATMDQDHLAPAMAAIEKGYDLLLEKPMGATPEECCALQRAATEKGVFVLVCHVLRFTPFFRALKAIIDSGRLGRIIHIQHAEGVGHLHQSHSFVRGNWGNSDRSTPMIVQKTCHDMDILQWLVGKQVSRVHSFGSLTYFKEENAPQGAPERCIDNCPHADTCYYNAVPLYYETWRTSSFLRAATKVVEPTDADIDRMLRTSDYGRCVFRSDNNVVDHQTVNLEFEDGATVSFSMCAFNKGARDIRIMGTEGDLVGHMGQDFFTFYSFATKEYEQISIADAISDETIDGGHGGGDTGIILALQRWLDGDRSNPSICTLEQTARNHLIAYAAEESRLQGKVVDMNEYEARLGGLTKEGEPK
ncbi:MAG: Gfo/Idh/MocA family oxidoreductase [Clostridia bacterium]|nr:Gfo/Idh/MocA family oxidoreductase [Clostridia bacterium]